MKDILPDQTPTWQYLEDVFRRLAGSYGYREIRFPALEQTALFKRSIGAVTDIVEKEMYSFDDRDGSNLSLRPEGTAGCVRAADQHGLLYNQQQRLWYQGPMFRHERPQKGRYRQFHQFGIEAFGMTGPDIDAEIIQFAAVLWQQLGLEEHIRLEVNNIGSAADRQKYAKELTAYLVNNEANLDEDARRRMHTNPMRILDSKNREVQATLVDAPKLADFISEPATTHHNHLLKLLDDANIKHTTNPRLVRGLDYYNNCVFEWTTDTLGAQGAVCGGGRYDGLVEQLGGKPTPAAGFAIGAERLVLMLDDLDKLPSKWQNPIDIYLMPVGPHLETQALALATEIRTQLPNLGVLCHQGGGKYNAQLKKAYTQAATLAIILERDDDSTTPLDKAKLRPINEDAWPNLPPTAPVSKVVTELKASINRR